MKLVAKFFIILLGVVLVFGACKQTSQSAADQNSEGMIDKAEIEAGLKDFANPLPEPFEVYSMLENIGASYLGKVLNSVDNAETYFSQKSKVVNVGVYAADLGYAASYNQKDDVAAYSKVLKSLLDDLGVSIDYSVLLSDEMSEKMADKDSLIGFVSDTYYDAYAFLYKESSPSLSALMAIGAWVEGMYIATHISEDTYQNTDIIKVIYSQSESLAGLIEFIEKFQEDEMIASQLGALKKLKVMFDETGGSLTEEQLNSIVSTIEAIRESIVS